MHYKILLIIQNMICSLNEMINLVKSLTSGEDINKILDNELTEKICRESLNVFIRNSINNLRNNDEVKLILKERVHLGLDQNLVTPKIFLHHFLVFYNTNFSGHEKFFVNYIVNECFYRKIINHTFEEFFFAEFNNYLAENLFSTESEFDQIYDFFFNYGELRNYYKKFGFGKLVIHKTFKILIIIYNSYLILEENNISYELKSKLNTICKSNEICMNFISSIYMEITLDFISIAQISTHEKLCLFIYFDPSILFKGSFNFRDFDQEYLYNKEYRSYTENNTFWAHKNIAYVSCLKTFLKTCSDQKLIFTHFKNKILQLLADISKKTRDLNKNKIVNIYLVLDVELLKNYVEVIKHELYSTYSKELQLNIENKHGFSIDDQISDMKQELENLQIKFIE